MPPMKVERIEEMRISETDEKAIGVLLNSAFGIGFDGRSYFQQRHHVRFVVRNGAIIIGHMALSIRAIRMGKKLVQVAGLAEVASHPEHRGQAIASNLMTAVISEARASPAHFLVLFGDQPLYSGVGFITVPNRTLSTSFVDVRTGEKEHRKGDKLMVMPLRDIRWDAEADIDLVGHAF